MAGLWHLVSHIRLVFCLHCYTVEFSHDWFVLGKKKNMQFHGRDTVDGCEILHQLKSLFIPLFIGFRPSFWWVDRWFIHVYHPVYRVSNVSTIHRSWSFGCAPSLLCSTWASSATPRAAARPQHCRGSFDAPLADGTVSEARKAIKNRRFSMDTLW